MFVVMRRRQTVRLTEDGDWPLVSRNSALLVMFTLLSSSSSSSNSRLWFTLTQPAPLWWQRPLQCLEAGGLSPSHLWPGLQVTALVWVPSPHLAEQGDQGPESQESQESQPPPRHSSLSSHWDTEAGLSSSIAHSSSSTLIHSVSITELQIILMTCHLSPLQYYNSHLGLHDSNQLFLFLLKEKFAS